MQIIVAQAWYRRCTSCAEALRVTPAGQWVGDVIALDLSGSWSCVVRHRPTVRLESARVVGVTARENYSVATSAGCVRLRGRLSAGSLGWRLRARVSCHRRRVSVDIVARQEELDARQGVEDHLYEVCVDGLAAGRYVVRLNHVWVVGPHEDQFMAMTVFEGAALIERAVSPISFDER